MCSSDLLQARMGGEGEEQALIGHEMFHHRREEAGLRRRLANGAEIDARERGETLQLVVVAGEKTERLDGHRFGTLG